MKSIIAILLFLGFLACVQAEPKDEVINLSFEDMLGSGLSDVFPGFETSREAASEDSRSIYYRLRLQGEVSGVNVTRYLAFEAILDGEGSRYIDSIVGGKLHVYKARDGKEIGRRVVDMPADKARDLARRLEESEMFALPEVQDRTVVIVGEEGRYLHADRKVSGVTKSVLRSENLSLVGREMAALVDEWVDSSL